VLTVKLNEAGIKRLLSSPDGAVYADIRKRGNRVLQRARVLAPVDQGQLRASLAQEMLVRNGAPIARIGTNVKYAIFVHEGTGVYGPRRTPITPVRKRLLSWPIKNNTGQGRRRYRGGATQRYAFAKQVQGVRPRPFLRKALDAAK